MIDVYGITAAVTYESKDTDLYIKKADDFGLETKWIGQIWKNAKTQFEFKVLGLKHKHNNWMLIVEDIHNSIPDKKVYNLVSIREFINDCEII